MAVGPATLARPAPVEGRPVTLRGLLEREGVFSWLMLAPGVLFLLAFVAYPLFYGLFLSLQGRRVANDRVLVGLASFRTLVRGVGFWEVAGNTVKCVVTTTLFSLTGGLAARCA